MTLPLHIETYGHGAREAVICNGLSQTTANWRGIARQNQDWRWILFDARGHGRSLLRRRPYAIDDHVDDLLFALDHAGADKPLLMGFSHGARVALRAAATHADRFAGVALVSCGSEQSPRRRAYVQSWEQCLRLGGLRALVWASMPAILGRKILESFPDLETLVHASAARNNEEGLLAMFEGMAGYPPVRDDALRADLPALVMRGGEDPLVVAQDLDNLCAWLPHASAVTFEDCGHTLPLEEPKRFMAEIERFAAGL